MSYCVRYTLVPVFDCIAVTLKMREILALLLFNLVLCAVSFPFSHWLTLFLLRHFVYYHLHFLCAIIFRLIKIWAYDKTWWNLSRYMHTNSHTHRATCLNNTIYFALMEENDSKTQYTHSNGWNDRGTQFEPKTPRPNDEEGKQEASSQRANDVDNERDCEEQNRPCENNNVYLVCVCM